jgi:hypothetical protein
VAGGSARPLPPALDDVAAVTGGGAGVTARVGAGPGGSVRRYHPHYRLPLGPAGGSDAMTHD